MKTRNELKASQRENAAQIKDKLPAKSRKNISHLKTADPSLFNQLNEQRFISLVLELVGESADGRVSKPEVLRECAYELDVNIETVKRYLFKHSARRAEFRDFGGWVFVNPRYEARDTAEDDDEGEECNDR